MIITLKPLILSANGPSSTPGLYPHIHHSNLSVSLWPLISSIRIVISTPPSSVPFYDFLNFSYVQLTVTYK